MRPAEERQLIRRKSFAFGPMSVEQAVDALRGLDHDFFLFRHAGTDADGIVFWRDDRAVGLIEPPAAKPADSRGVTPEKSRFPTPIDLNTAVAEMDALEAPFLFFENAATGRGNVVYRRYDGHYGLIEPA